MVDGLQLMLPGEVSLLLLHPQLAVGGLWRHKQGLLEAQPLGSHCAHKGLKQCLRVPLLRRAQALLLS